MPDTTFLRWPFFDEAHRTFGDALRQWATHELADVEPEEPGIEALDRTCRGLVKQLGAAGWLRYVVPASYGGVTERLDVRSLCIARETLASASGLADFAFAMQGLGGGPIALFGSDALKQRYLPKIATGETIAAFAISEAQGGSDVAAMQTTARRDGNGYVIDGEKTWISNAGIADHYIVFCRLAGEGERAHIALVVDAETPGFEVTRRIDVTAPHPLGTLTFRECRVSGDAVVGHPGKGLGVALGTLDVFRSTVGAAALGFARRALDEATRYVITRNTFGNPLADFQLTRAKIAEMATKIDASALLIYRAAWTRDSGAERITREAAMAKWYATEAAQEVVDHAIQLLGARGIVAGAPVEQLYREVRALRIYEGTSEIQQLVIAGQVLAQANTNIEASGHSERAAV